MPNSASSKKTARGVEAGKGRNVRYGWQVAGILVLRRLHYRVRLGAWCEHPTFAGILVDMGMRKLYICETCGHSTFYPQSRRRSWWSLALR